MLNSYQQKCMVFVNKEQSIEKEFFSKRNRLAQFQAFSSVVQSNFSMTVAAEKLDIELSALSRQIIQLEKDMGVKLLDRSNTRRLKFTKEGELFYNDIIGYINGIESSFLNFNEHFKNFNDTHLNIALHQMAATYIFPPILERMLKLEEFKNLKINIYTITKDDAIKRLIEKEIDLAFYVNTPKEIMLTEIETIRSIPSHVSLVFNKNHHLAKKKEITVSDMEECKFLKRNIETKTYSNVYDNFNTKLSNIGVPGASFETVLEMVKITNDLSTVPELFLENNRLAHPEIDGRNIDHLIDRAYFYVMTLKNSIMTKPKKWIIEEFKKLAIK